MLLTEEVLDQFLPRDQQIFCAEAFAAVAATYHVGERFRDRDVLWWVGNAGALSTLVKGNSSQFDAGVMSAIAHLAWASLAARVWFELEASDEIPSDGLSRNGVVDVFALIPRMGNR